MRRQPGHPLLVAALACSLLLLGTGCGGDKSEPQDRADDHYLDTPDLAELPTVAVTEGVPVLCYHYFRGRFAPGYLLKVVGSLVLGMPALGPREFWTTPVAEFERHLQYFRDTGTRVMTLDEVADLVAAGRPLPPRAVVITIDDADRSVYRQAYPLLRKYGLRAHLFVPTGQVGSHWSGLDVCTWDELAEMAGTGTMILGSHSRDLHYKVRVGGRRDPIFWHPDRIAEPERLDTLTDVGQLMRAHPQFVPPDLDMTVLEGEFGPVAADLLASRLDIAAATGHTPRWLAWPYGFAHGRLDSVSRAVGFRGSVSLRPAAFSAADTLLQPGRFTLTAKTTLDQIAATFPQPPLP